ncbi:VRR-NUC domain-containing protein [Paenibacillus albicereus]|uniref:VRR-NUC domain-containing protein n=1 Tax=Paenibacillus albicereus TaxID=2726185 RepID=A0A6H2H054_9BACL|nr:VRR-NUC domain-containing protein [Paenibacillus albicereus]
MKESELERILVRRVRAAGGRAVKWTAPGEAGVPDRIVLLPDGRIAFVEMKAPGGRLAPLQVRWARILQEMGHRHYTIDSREAIDRFVQEELPE